MRRTITAVLATAGLALAVAAIPAAGSTGYVFHTCEPNGNTGTSFHVSKLSQSGVGCGNAREYAWYYLHHGTPAHWTCHVDRTTSAPAVNVICERADRNHAVDFTYKIGRS